MEKSTYWIGSIDKCDVCKGPFNGTMYDASIPTAGGSWGNVCKGCFTAHGCSLGVGRGQRYEKQADGRWLKKA